MQNGIASKKDDRRLVTLATITGAHGLKGALKLTVDIRSDAILEAGRTVMLKLLSGQVQHHTISRVKLLGPRSRLLFLDHITHREAAQVFKGAEVQVFRTALPSLEESSYYWCDLIGLAVIDVHRGRVGELTDILQTGANDVYIVKEGKRETLIPVIKSVVQKVDLIEGYIQVELPDGL